MRKFLRTFMGYVDEIPRWEPHGEDIKTYTASTHGRNLRVSELEELRDLSSDDYVMVVDTSEKKSCKVKLSTFKKFIKS